MSKICLAMMVKHEAQTMERAIELCRPFVDHVLISVDKSSTDGTRELAHKIGDTVKEHDFTSKDAPHGSFAKSRQSLIDAIRELGYGWVLQVDGHEYLYCKNRMTLKKLIQQNPSVDAFGLALVMNDTVIRQVKLYKSDEYIQYQGDIHNYLSGVKKEFYCPDVEVIHDRAGQPIEHVQERNKQRSEMSDKILGQRIKDNPNDSRSMFYLAQSYKETGRTEEAIEMFQRYLKVSHFISEKWNARHYLYGCLQSLGRIDEAYKVIEESFEDQERAEAWLILGDRAYAEEDYKAALDFYQKASLTPYPSNYVFINDNAYNWLPHDKMAMCHSHLENYMSAIEEAAQAIKTASIKDTPRLASNILFWTKELRQRGLSPEQKSEKEVS